MIIGYIYDIGYNEYPEIYKKVDNIDSVDKPLLIVGWKIAKQLFPEDFSINNFCIKDNIYWTCSLVTDRMTYLENLTYFKEVCIGFQVSKFEYKYYDMFLYKYNDIVFEDYDSILSRSNIIYIKSVESILGISLELCTHLGFDILTDLKNATIKTHEISPDFKDLKGYKIMCF